MKMRDLYHWLRIHWKQRQGLAKKVGWWKAFTQVSIKVKVSRPANHDGKVRFNGKVVDPDKFFLKEDE